MKRHTVDKAIARGAGAGEGDNYAVLNVTIDYGELTPVQLPFPPVH